MHTEPSVKVAAIVLAAGRGTRMKSDRAKVLHPVAGRPILFHVLDLLTHLSCEQICVIVGHQAEAVETAMAEARYDVTCILQDPQQGTGHAVLQARRALGDFPGTVLIVGGDTPCLGEGTLRHLVSHHHQAKATFTVLTTTLSQPRGYGRIVRADNGAIVRVVEERDATAAERAVREINAGLYAAQAPFLFEAVTRLGCDNDQKEYYLTDVVRMAAERRLLASVRTAAEEVLGVNSRQDLAEAERILRKRINARWMAEGVTLLDPATTRIDASVTLSRDVVLHPGVTLEGHTRIGERAVLYPCRIKDSAIGPEVLIKDHCVIEDATIEANAVIGPFAHIRPGSRIRKAAKVGNFVEIKKSDLGEGARANHLTYLGDTTVGRDVNIGAGTITCNFDGETKHSTVIEDGVFVGSGVQMVAPVRIGARSTIAAGTTVTEDVPPDTLALARVPQQNKAGWVHKKSPPPTTDPPATDPAQTDPA